jgi:hypothetical protein
MGSLIAPEESIGDWMVPFQELRRRGCVTHGLEREANLPALVRLIGLKHNRHRQPAADWAHHVTADLLAHGVRLRHTTQRQPLT